MQLNNYEPFPTTLPIIVEDSTFLYPFMISPLFLTKKEDIDAVTYAMDNNSLVFITTTREGYEGSREFEDINRVGVIGSIMRKVPIPDGRVKILFQGLGKGEIVSNGIDTVESEDGLIFQSATIDIIYNREYDELKINALISILNEKLQQLSKIQNQIPPDLLKTVSETTEPYRVADLVSSLLKLSKGISYTIFKEQDIEKRLMALLDIIITEIESARVEREIRSKVHSKIEKTNKEYFLKEQIKEINKELGQDGQREEEIEEFKKRLEEIKKDISEDAYKEIKKQLDRFTRMHPDSGDAQQLHTYLEWVFEMPFGKLTGKNLKVKDVERELNRDHYSLQKPKERIIEFFSVRELAHLRGVSIEKSGAILCFFGPPGVGKTSLANSIANALNRPLVRIALGGLEDVNELRGHRRTYVGAMPGRIVQGLIDAKSMDPVIVLDEVDKVGRNYRGDPTAVLLEILDPEQNREYRDYYLNFNIDLSKAIFIATANDLGTIPAPLRDRMEFIELSSYTPEEKIEIAKGYLIPQELKKHALKRGEFRISDGALRVLIDEYTREAGVRDLRRKIATLMRKVATMLLKDSSISRVNINLKNLSKFADKKIFEVSKVDREPLIGVVNGLAWTAVGGDMLKIEAIKIKGKGQIKLTGSLGDVMKESAHIAFSVIKILIDNRKLDGKEEDIYNKYDLHIHIPEGATPKDGPSAGITMATAIASILSEKRVDNKVAMTGELTLTGKVLPIGGLKEKLIAAHKAGVTKALIPTKNYKRDLEDIPQEVRNSIKIIPVDRIEDVLKESIEI